MNFFVFMGSEDTGEKRIVGPYRTFKRAEDAAKYWDRRNGWHTCVLPVTSPSEQALTDVHISHTTEEPQQ